MEHNIVSEGHRQ